MERIGDRREAVLVVNTQSRRGQRLYAQAKREIGERGIRLAAAYPVRDATRVPAIVAEAVAQGHGFIIVGGGDGTVSSVVSSLANRDTMLGLLPMGTANNFAKANRIPLDLPGAIDVLVSGKLAQVDLGRLEQTYFTNAVSIGITSAIHRGSPDPLKRYLGRAGYLLAAARQLAACKAFTCRLVLDGRSVELTAYDVRVANGPFQGGLRAVEAARVDSGDLVVRVIKGPSKWNLGRVWARTGMGRADDPAQVESFRAREIEVSAEPRQFVSVDGEAVTRTPVRIHVEPGALRLIVPQAQ